jgi:catalase (peroxidase I)
LSSSSQASSPRIFTNSLYFYRKMQPIHMATALFLVALNVNAFVDPRRPDIAHEFNGLVAGCSPHARAWIRAAFHGAGTFSNQARDGGNTGAFQFEGDRFENRGLEGTIGFYRDMVSRFGISFADALTFGGIVAVQACNGPDIPFQPGRLDTARGPGPVNRLPNPHISGTDILGTFVDRMGFTIDETVALIGGGHTVALISAANSESNNDVRRV